MLIISGQRRSCPTSTWHLLSAREVELQSGVMNKSIIKMVSFCKSSSSSATRKKSKVNLIVCKINELFFRFQVI